MPGSIWHSQPSQNGYSTPCLLKNCQNPEVRCGLMHKNDKGSREIRKEIAATFFLLNAFKKGRIFFPKLVCGMPCLEQSCGENIPWQGSAGFVPTNPDWDLHLQLESLRGHNSTVMRPKSRNFLAL